MDPMSGDGHVAVGPDRVPDARANAQLRNDCLEIAGKALPDNVADSIGRDGPISRFGRLSSGEGWTPIVGESHEAPNEMSMVSQRWGSNDLREPPQVCRKLMSIFALPGEGQGKDAILYAARLEHEVVDFAFPKDLASAPPVDTAVAVKVKSTLHVDYERPVVRDDGTIAPELFYTRNGEAQAWPLEVTCETPFTVTPRWEENMSMPTHGTQFCKTDGNGGARCLSFRFDYTGDKCSFVARDATVKLATGETVRATFAGYFDRRPSTGYAITVTNIELR
jgi:hypothetical protein